MPNRAQRREGRWTGLSAEDRRAQRRSLVLDAAFELLGTEGWAGTTVRAVCQRSELNPRYFYESFRDLDELLVAVYDRVVAEMATAVRAAVDAAPQDDLRHQLHAAIDAIVAFVDDDPRRGRILYVEALGNEALNRRRIETGHTLVDMLEQDAATRRRIPPGRDPVGKIAAAIVVGGFGEVLGAWLGGRIAVGRARLVDEATDMLYAIVSARRPQKTV